MSSVHPSSRPSARTSSPPRRASTRPVAPPRTRKQQADHTRARLLELAWELVQREGLPSFTVRRLAAQAGVAVGLPYVYFGTRDGLLDELRERAWDRVDSAIEAAIGPEAALATAHLDEGTIRRGIHGVVDFAIAQPNVFSLVALTPGTQLSDRALLREAASAQKFLRALLRGQKDGHFQFRGDPIVFALALWTSLQGHIQRMSASASPVFMAFQAQVLEQILDVFFHHVRPALPPPTGAA
jgi:AcrR family transcriptional regulator